MDSGNYIDGNEFIPGALGDRIACLRKRKKMTQAQVAEQLGISAQAVSKWESGLSCPDIMTLVPLAVVLGVSTDALLGVGSGMESGSVEEDGGMLGHGSATAGVGEMKNDDVPAGSVGAASGSAVVDDSIMYASSRSADDNMPEPSIITEDSSIPEDETQTPEPAGEPTNFIIVSPNGSIGHDITSVRISAGACTAVIQPGREFNLRTEGYGEDEVVSKVEDGIWIVHDKAKNHLFSGRNTLFKRKMWITVPENMPFDFVELNIGAGVIKAEGIRANHSVLNVGAGQMKLKRFISNDSKIRCGMGEITIKGALYGPCDMDCGMGSITAYIEKPEHYGYRASVGVGEIKIGNSQIGGLGGSQSVNEGDPNFYKISCSMGSVQLRFKE